MRAGKVIIFTTWLSVIVSRIESWLPKGGFTFFQSDFSCVSLSRSIWCCQENWVFRHPQFLLQLPSNYQLILMPNQVMINCINQSCKNVTNQPWPQHHLWPAPADKTDKKNPNSFCGKGHWNTPVLLFFFWSRNLFCNIFCFRDSLLRAPSVFRSCPIAANHTDFSVVKEIKVWACQACLIANIGRMLRLNRTCVSAKPRASLGPWGSLQAHLWTKKKQKQMRVFRQIGEVRSIYDKSTRKWTSQSIITLCCVFKAGVLYSYTTSSVGLLQMEGETRHDLICLHMEF